MGGRDGDPSTPIHTIPSLLLGPCSCASGERMVGGGGMRRGPCDHARILRLDWGMVCVCICGVGWWLVGWGGRVSLKTVRDLILKRGFTMAAGASLPGEEGGGGGRRRVALTNNQLVEERLGKAGLVCIEDVVHEIATVGHRFKDAAQFLCPFELFRPRGSKLPPPPAQGVEFGQWIDELMADIN